MKQLTYFLIFSVFSFSLIAKGPTTKEQLRALARELENPDPAAQCDSCHAQNVENEVQRCGEVSSTAADMWRDLQGRKVTKLENGKIVLTYSILGCPDKEKFTKENYPSCENYHQTITEVLDFFQSRVDKIILRKVESDAQINFKFQPHSPHPDRKGPYGEVISYNSNAEQIEVQERENRGMNPASGSQYRTSRTDLYLNTNHCLWYGDPSICTPPNWPKPSISIPDFKSLVLHEFIHTLGFKHTDCEPNGGSIIGVAGGHGHFELNDFDLTMINYHYTRIIDSYQN